MIVIICIDDDGGTMFNNRRQSKDVKLIEKVIDITKGSKLWLNKYSYDLFENTDTVNINIDESFLSEAQTGEFCFVENNAVKPFEKRIEKLIVFRWNRSYPYDRKFDIDFSTWQLVDSTDIVGKSHTKITMEEYIK